MSRTADGQNPASLGWGDQVVGDLVAQRGLRWPWYCLSFANHVGT